MIKRGTILRDTSAGPGLVAVDGEHFQFSPETPCQLPFVLIAGTPVDVEFAPDCRILNIVAVNEPKNSDPRQTVNRSSLSGTRFGRRGVLNLFATALLLIGWTLLGSISFKSSFGQMNWDLLGFLNSGSGWKALSQGRIGTGTGAYGLLAILVVAAPYVQHVWHDKRAWLFGLTPLLFMLYVGLTVRISLHQAFGTTAEGALGEIQRQAQEEMMRAVSLGIGAYFSVLMCAHFAVNGAIQFFHGRGTNTEVVGNINCVNRRVEA